MSPSESTRLPTTDLVEGIVTRLNTTRGRGFGFLVDADGNEYFLHRTACVPNSLFDELAEGDALRFRVGETPKGQKAYAVERIPQSAVTRRMREREENRGNR